MANEGLQDKIKSELEQFYGITIGSNVNDLLEGK